MSLTKYIDQLPIPSVLEPKAYKGNDPYYEVTMREIWQQLHSELPPTKVWGYEGYYPGPTIEVTKNQPIWVKWINNLPIKHHLLPVDKTIHGAEPPNPEVRTVVHLHGANVPAHSDGYPEAWFTNSFMQTGPFFERTVYYYPNRQRAAALWYHDHAIGITRLNVYAGLAGIYFIRDEIEQNLNLPSGDYEVPLLIQDRSFNEDGSLFYPADEIGGVQPSIEPEFFGDTILVNGKVWPYLDVEPRKYRFRIVNGSNSRFYNMRLKAVCSQMSPSWHLIGTDQGLVEEPIPLDNLLLGPAERADVIVDFSGFTNREFILTNDAPTPFPDGDPVDEDTSQIMKFRVKNVEVNDDSELPAQLDKINWFPESSATKVRNMTLVEETDGFGRLLMLLEGLMWDDPITTRPVLGTIEVWNLINLTEDTHPIHLHLVKSQILERRPFDVDFYNETGQIRYTGPPNPLDPSERGWKDTINAHPDEVTRIISQFVDYPGRYPWHCHILEHEDHEMMRPFEVVKPSHPCPSKLMLLILLLLLLKIISRDC